MPEIVQQEGPECERGALTWLQRPQAQWTQLEPAGPSLSLPALWGSLL